MSTIYLIGFFSSLAGVVLAVPLAAALSRRFGVLDHPGPRKIHREPIPRWGGIGIYAGVMAGLAAVYLSHPRFRLLLSFRQRIIEDGEVVGMVALKKQFLGVLFGGFLIFALGLLDDKKSLPAWPKLLFMIIAAYVTMDFGVRMAGLAIPGLGFMEFPTLVSQAVTILWLLGFMNTVNLADGLDGLAAGIAAIAAWTFFVACLLQGETGVLLYAKQMKLAAVLSVTVAAAALGFLLYNFYPAKVFMGDGGALFLGYMLGVISILGTLKTSALLSLVVPVLVVALPVFDVAFAILRRWRAGSGLLQPDQGHMHHRLLSLGWSQREAVLLLYVLTLALSMAAILLAVFKGRP